MVLIEYEAATNPLELTDVLLDSRLIHFGEAARIEAHVNAPVAQAGQYKVGEDSNVTVSKWLGQRTNFAEQSNLLVRKGRCQVVRGDQTHHRNIIVDILEGLLCELQQMICKSAETPSDLANDWVLDIVGQIKHPSRIEIMT